MRMRVMGVVLALFLAGASPAVAAPSASLDKVEEWLSTTCDEAWFWSGRIGDVSVKETARTLARARDGSTLEIELAEEGVPEPSQNNDRLWEQYSRYFAQGARCQVRAVFGDVVRPGSVWETIEFPALRANPNITYVLGVDPRTGAECFKWKRADLPDPPQPPCA